MNRNRTLLSIKRLLLFFMLALFLSGITAIPVDHELKWVLPFIPSNTQMEYWLLKVHDAYSEVKEKHLFLLYGYDWLAFAHIILAILFIGPYRDPVRNIWVLQFGLIACALILPMAFMAGHFREIPLGWVFIDCSFGVLGAIPLWICYRKTLQLASFPQ